MSVILAKWGNALGVRIPSHIVKKMHLHQGDAIEIELLPSGEILLKPAVRKLVLKELLSQINDKNCHGETNWGHDEGEEF